MENNESPKPKKVEIIIPEYTPKIEHHRKEGIKLQEKSDSLLPSLKELIAKRDILETFLAHNPNDAFTQQQLNALEFDIKAIHDTMNDLAVEKINTNYNAETYETVSQMHGKTIAKVSKENLN